MGYGVSKVKIEERRKYHRKIQKTDRVIFKHLLHLREEKINNIELHQFINFQKEANFIYMKCPYLGYQFF